MLILLRSLKASQSGIEKIHHKLFELAEYLGDFVGAKPLRPRVCGRQQNLANHNARKEIDYFRIKVTIPFVDHVITEIENRFGSSPLTDVKGFCIVPDFIVN